jgi:diguanylate cyclase (GGDEF)-like protein
MGSSSEETDLTRVRNDASDTAPGSGQGPEGPDDLRQVVLAAHQELDIAEQFRLLLQHAVDLAGAEQGFAFGLGEERGALVPLGATAPKGDARFRALPKLLRDHVVEWIGDGDGRFEGAGPLAAQLRHWPGEEVAASLLLPLETHEGEVAGALWLTFAALPPAEASTRVRELLDAVRPAVGNAAQVHAMRLLVIKDDTASCYNRRYFEEFLPEEMSRASRFRAPLSLIFFDLDNLKQVNNAHGHAMGSRTLNEVSVRVRVKIRKFDKLFRFGGDEFCIVLPETEWHGALEVAERVRDAISGSPFLTDRTSAGPAGVDITASFGIASFPLHARDKESLVQEADRAMQKIKRDGKNAVGVAEIVGERHGG